MNSIRLLLGVFTVLALQGCEETTESTEPVVDAFGSDAKKPMSAALAHLNDAMEWGVKR
jgi:hypothetical protein